MMTLLYLLLLPMLSGIGMLGLGPALMAGRAGAAHVVLRACCSCRSCRCGCLPWSLRCI